jgi:hypothetical protein
MIKTKQRKICFGDLIMFSVCTLSSAFFLPCSLPFYTNPHHFSYIPRPFSMLLFLFFVIVIWLLLCHLLYCSCSQLPFVSHALFFITHRCTSPFVSFALPSTFFAQALRSDTLCFVHPTFINFTFRHLVVYYTFSVSDGLTE